MSILVYVGANRGISLSRLFRDYDYVYAFEPDPEIFIELYKSYSTYPWVTLVNAACSTYAGREDFYIYPNRVSSSLAPVADGIPTDELLAKTEVNVINLFDYLLERRINYIDYLVSDCQGSDLTILKTLKPLINSKSINRIMVETHNSNKDLYSGLSNGFDGFKTLLEANYEIEHVYLGRLDGQEVLESEIPHDEYEWDTVWKVKDA